MDDFEQLQAKIAKIADSLAKRVKPFSQDFIKDCLGRMEIPIDGTNAFLHKLFSPYYRSIGCTVTCVHHENVTIFSDKNCQPLFPSFENLKLGDIIILRFFLNDSERPELPILHEDVEITLYAENYEVHHNGEPPITVSLKYFEYWEPNFIRQLEKSISESMSINLAYGK